MIIKGLFFLCPLEGFFITFHIDVSDLIYLGLFLLISNVSNLIYLG